MNKSNNKISITSTTVLSDGKSTRLMEMRRKAMGVATPEPTQQSDCVVELDKSVETELLKARQIIDQHLTDILNKYPVNKQSKFFEIRFGMRVEQLKNLSIKEICTVLAVKQKQPESMKRIADLDYNGRLTL